MQEKNGGGANKHTNRQHSEMDCCTEVKSEPCQQKQGEAERVHSMEAYAHVVYTWLLQHIPSWGKALVGPEHRPTHRAGKLVFAEWARNKSSHWVADVYQLADGTFTVYSKGGIYDEPEHSIQDPEICEIHVNECEDVFHLVSFLATANRSTEPTQCEQLLSAVIDRVIEDSEFISTWGAINVECTSSLLDLPYMRDLPQIRDDHSALWEIE